MKLTGTVVVKNKLGLHTRPATTIVKLLHNCKSEVTFAYNGEVINAKSILSILTLAAGQKAEIGISVDGVDAKETLEALKEAFENQFGELY